MENKGELINEYYNKNLKADDYIRFLEEDYRENPHSCQIPLKFIHNILHSGRFKGSKLLDIGSGPVVHNIASASAFYSNIIMGDYVEDLCEQLKCWLNGKLKMKQFLDFPAELEGYGKNLEVGKQLLEKRIKECVKQVVRCDVLNDNIFLEEVKPEVAPPYDLITALSVLDAVCPDINNFMLALKRMNKLLRPGGGLILIGDFDDDSWKVGEIEYHNLQISESDIKKALKESGFKIIDLQITHGKDFGGKEEHMHDFYCLAAEKL